MLQVRIMPKKSAPAGPLHDVPSDMKKVLDANPKVLEQWDSLTPLAQNEWICWTTIVKKDDTRKDHIRRMEEDLLSGKKRPCCWPGCPHRNPKNKKWFR